MSMLRISATGCRWGGCRASSGVGAAVMKRPTTRVTGDDQQSSIVTFTLGRPMKNAVQY